MFCNDKFSEFAEIGDLSKFTFNELKNVVINFKVDSKFINDIIVTKWTNNNSIYEITYTLSGKFIKIQSEIWLKPYCEFRRIL
jgi:hypothetical protein